MSSVVRQAPFVVNSAAHGRNIPKTHPAPLLNGALKKIHTADGDQSVSTPIISTPDASKQSQDSQVVVPDVRFRIKDFDTSKSCCASSRTPLCSCGRLVVHVADAKGLESVLRKTVRACRYCNASMQFKSAQDCFCPSAACKQFQFTSILKQGGDPTERLLEMLYDIDPAKLDVKCHEQYQKILISSVEEAEKENNETIAFLEQKAQKVGAKTEQVEKRVDDLRQQARNETDPVKQQQTLKTADVLDGQVKQNKETIGILQGLLNFFIWLKDQFVRFFKWIWSFFSSKEKKEPNPPNAKINDDDCASEDTGSSQSRGSVGERIA